MRDIIVQEILIKSLIRLYEMDLTSVLACLKETFALGLHITWKTLCVSMIN